MLLEKRLDEFLSTVQAEPLQFVVNMVTNECIFFSPAKANLYTTSADLNDPVNDLFERSLQGNFNPQTRCYEICREATLTTIVYQLVCRLNHLITRVLGDRHSLRHWYQHNFGALAYTRRDDVVSTLFQIYCYAVISDKDAPLNIAVHPQKIPQFKTLMAAFKDKFFKEKGVRRYARKSNS